MQKIKHILRIGINGLKIWKEFGFYSLKKRIQIKRYHNAPDLQVLKDLHLIEEDELERQRNFKFGIQIKFSIITPLYNTPENFLIQLIQSLEEQTYSNWELCLADGSDDEHRYVRQICEDYAEKDDRIIYHILNENRGISENTNECIKLATGQYFGLLDHDDILHASALYEVMKVIQDLGADFIYTDEVKFSGDIREIKNPLDFNLKPGFGKDDLRSHNYICHFTVFNRKLLEGENELYRKECDGSQDHDMVLRLTEKTDSIVHIPKVLYYWRVHSNSVSMDLNTKSYAVDAAIRAVSEQLDRLNEKGRVVSNSPFRTLYRIFYDLEAIPLVSIILYSFNENVDLNTVSKNVRENTSYPNIEILNMNYHTDSYESISKRWNQMTDRAQGKFIVLLDARCTPLKSEWIEEMLMFAQREDVCSVSPKIYYKDNTIAFAGASIDWSTNNKLRLLCQHNTREDIGYEAMLCHARETTTSLSTCMMFSKERWKELDGFQNMCGYEDVDFCLRGGQAGKNNVWTCFAEMNFGGRKIVARKEKWQVEQFENAWEEQIEKDKFYHKMWDALRLM